MKRKRDLYEADGRLCLDEIEDVHCQVVVKRRDDGRIIVSVGFPDGLVLPPGDGIRALL